MENCGSCKFHISSYTAEKWTFPAFQQTMVGNQGGQDYSKCMKMSTSRSDLVILFVSTEVEIMWERSISYFFLFNGCLPGLHLRVIVARSLFNFHVQVSSLTNTQTKFLKSRKALMLIIKCKYMYLINQESSVHNLLIIIHSQLK